MSVNRVFLIGRIGRDPEIKHGQSAFCTFSVATSEKWKDKNSGQQHEKTEWHNCIAFGRTAELITSYCQKGSNVYIEGKLSTTQKDDKYFTNIQVQTVQFLDSKKENSDSSYQAPEYKAPDVKDSFYDEIPF